MGSEMCIRDRHTYVTWLSMSGRPVKVVQELARHSTPLLTLGVYTHVSDLDRTAALGLLPDLTRAEPQRQAKAVTSVTVPEGCAAPALHSHVTPLRAAAQDGTAGDGDTNENPPAGPGDFVVSQGNTEVGRGGIEPPTHGFSVHCSTS